MKTFKVIAVLVLVFCAGAAGGVVATRMAMRHFVARAMANPDMMRLRMERELMRKLDLDRQQRMQTSAALRNAHERMRTVREQFQPQFAVILADARREISNVLTPEQQKKFEKFQAENGRFRQR